ncbi:hypothetical protein STEG23_032593, partial [Scotinomys teguina]
MGRLLRHIERLTGKKPGLLPYITGKADTHQYFTKCISEHAISEHAISEHAISEHAISEHAISEHAISEHAQPVASNFITGTLDSLKELPVKT